MKLENSMTWPDHFLRRMVSWARTQINTPASTIRLINFRQRSSRQYSGHAYHVGRRIVVSVNRDGSFPCAGSYGRDGYFFADAIEALVAVTAHEIYHLAANSDPNHQQKTRGRESFASSEACTIAAERKVLEVFRANRDALLADWNEAPAMEIKPSRSVQEIRAIKAAASLAKWERKMKLAANKVKKYLRQVAYYEKALPMAACR